MATYSYIDPQGVKRNSDGSEYIPNTTIITPDSLKPAQAVNFNAAPTSYVPDITKIEIGGAPTTQQNLTQPEQQVQDLTTQLEELNKQLLGQSSYRTEQEKNQNIQGLTQTQTDLQNKIKLLQTEAISTPLKVQNEFLGRASVGEMGGESEARLRQNAVAALETSALLSAAQGNLATAQSFVDRAVEAKFNPIKEQIAAKNANLEIILKSPAYTLAEKNRAQQLLDVNNAQLEKTKKEEEDRKSILSVGQEAAKLGADALTLDKINKAKTPLEATQIASAAGVYTTTTDKNVSDLLKKYPDAGISSADTLEVAQEKIKNSAIYQKSIGKTSTAESSLISKGYVYVATPAERDKLKEEGRTVEVINGKTYVAPTKIVKTSKGGYDIVDSITNKIIGGKTATVPVYTSRGVVNKTSVPIGGATVVTDKGIAGWSSGAIDLAAENYLQTKQLPAIGMAKEGANIRGAIISRAAEIAKRNGNDAQAASLQSASYKADANSLSQIIKQRDFALSFEKTAKANLDLAKSFSDKVDRAGSPVINKWALYVKGQYAGDPDTLALAAAIKTATNEYAKVVTGQTGGAAVSDSARAETEKMLNAAYSKEAFNKIIEVMKSEMANREVGYNQQVDEIHKRMSKNQEKTNLSDPDKEALRKKYNY